MGRVRKKYSREFKLEAVRALRLGKHTASELARRLNVTESHLRDWNMQPFSHWGQIYFLCKISVIP